MAKWTAEQLKHIADILMAAAHADGDVQKIEGSAVREVLKGLAGGALAKDLAARIDGFKLAAFDLGKAAAALMLGDAATRKELLQLVARVTESDDVHDLEESDFIVRVANAIGASREEYAGLTITLEESVKPPPLPAS